MEKRLIHKEVNVQMIGQRGDRAGLENPHPGDGFRVEIQKFEHQMTKELSFYYNYGNFDSYNTLNKQYFFAFLFAFSATGLHRVEAQVPASVAVPGMSPTSNQGETSLVARNVAVASSRPANPVPSVDATTAKPVQTKLLQIYGGAGFFNLALAEKLRPRLAKGLAATKPDGVRSLPDPVLVPVKTEAKQVQTVSKL